MSDEHSQFLLTLQYTIDAVHSSEDTDAALRAVRDHLDKIAAMFWELLHALTLIRPRDDSMRTAVEGADD